MTDLSNIPQEELLKDFDESLDDVLVCAKALEEGIKFYSSGSVLERLEKNTLFVRMIFAEVQRRNKDKS